MKGQRKSQLKKLKNKLEEKVKVDAERKAQSIIQQAEDKAR